MIRSVCQRVLCAAVLLFCATMRTEGQEPAPPRDPFRLEHFDEAAGMCRGKGRLQDTEYCRSATMDAILAKGKDAVPILIAQLTDERVVKMPILDYWNEMKVGDIAYVILRNLFTDAGADTLNLSGLESTQDACSDGANTCWRLLVRMRGRRSIQRQWLAAWNANKSEVYWDATARTFKMPALENVSCDVKYQDHNQVVPRPISLQAVKGVVETDVGNEVASGACIGVFTEGGHRLVAAVQSDAAGKFSFPMIPPGAYRLVVQYSDLCAPNARIRVGGPARRKILLHIHMKFSAVDDCSYVDLKSKQPLKDSGNHVNVCL